MKVRVLTDFRALDTWLVSRRVRIPDEIRKQLNAEGSHAVHKLQSFMGPSAYPTSKTGNLRRSVRYRTFAKSTGNIGVIVGPWPRAGGYHRWLVERGHRIVGHRPNRINTGARATANPRVSEARPSVEAILEAALDRALENVTHADG